MEHEGPKQRNRRRLDARRPERGAAGPGRGTDPNRAAADRPIDDAFDHDHARPAAGEASGPQDRSRDGTDRPRRRDPVVEGGESSRPVDHQRLLARPGLRLRGDGARPHAARRAWRPRTGGRQPRRPLRHDHGRRKSGGGRPDAASRSGPRRRQRIRAGRDDLRPAPTGPAGRPLAPGRDGEGQRPRGAGERLHDPRHARQPLGDPRHRVGPGPRHATRESDADPHHRTPGRRVPRHARRRVRRRTDPAALFAPVEQGELTVLACDMLGRLRTSRPARC